MRTSLVVAVPALLCALLLAAADPRGNFPLNDDFNWSDAAFRLAAGGGLRLGQLVVASAVAHVTLGALPVFLFGATDWVLRVWTMAWGCAAAGGLALLASRCGVPAAAALAVGCALAGDPLHLSLAASFHMEITMMAGVLLAAWALAVHHETGSWRALAAASAALGFAALVRQTAAVAVLGPLLLLASRRRLGWRDAAALLVPVLTAVALWQFWLRCVHGVTWGAVALKPYFGPADLLRPVSVLEAVRRVAGAFTTAAFLASPVALLALPAAWAAGRPKRGEALAGAGVLALLADGWARGGLPLLGNILTTAGLGVVTLNAPELKEAGWWRSGALWTVADAAALVSAGVFLRLLWPRDGEAPKAGRARMFFVLAAVPVAAAAALTDNFDRYLLAWLPLFLLAGAVAAGASVRPAAGLAAALLMGCWSSAGVRDYFAWNRARWDAGMRAVARGVPAEKVENGFDWDGRLTLERNMEALLKERPPEDIGMWDWMTLNRVVALTSFSSTPPRADFVPVESVPYRTPLARGERRVYLYGLSTSRGPAAPSAPAPAAAPRRRP